MKSKSIILCIFSFLLLQVNICLAESINYSVVEKSKKDDSPSATVENIIWTVTPESFKTRETWNNYKDAINCQVKVKDIQKCEILHKDAQDDLSKSKTYIPFSLSFQLKGKLPICQRIFEENNKNSSQVFSFSKIDMPLDTEARGKEIGSQLNCLVTPKPDKPEDNKAKNIQQDSTSKVEDAKLKEEALAKKAEEARLKKEELAKKKQEAAAKKEEMLAKIAAEDAKLKEAALAKKAEQAQKAKAEEAKKAEANAKTAEVDPKAPEVSPKVPEAAPKAPEKAPEAKEDNNKDLFTIQLNSEQVVANNPAEFTVEVKPHNGKLNCGISIATGDGNSQKFYVTDKENVIHYSYAYTKPGNYEASIDGKTFVKGWTGLALPCTGLKKTVAVTVGENKVELELKAKVEEEAALAKKAELEQKAKIEEAKKEEATTKALDIKATEIKASESKALDAKVPESQATEAKDDNKDLFTIQLNAESLTVNKTAEFIVEVKPYKGKLNCCQVPKSVQLERYFAGVQVIYLKRQALVLQLCNVWKSWKVCHLDRLEHFWLSKRRSRPRALS